MNLSDNCCQNLSHKIVQKEENKKTFRIKNNNQKTITVCRVDGCLIKGDEIKCDFMFVVEQEVLFLVEMKGGDHVHALRQIITSGEVLKISNFAGLKKSAIVGSPSPKAASSYQNEQVKLAKRFKAIGLDFPAKKNNLVEVCI